MVYRKRVNKSYRSENLGNPDAMMRELQDDMAMLERRIERRKKR